MKKVLVLLSVVLASLVTGGRAASADPYGTCFEANNIPDGSSTTVCVP